MAGVLLTQIEAARYLGKSREKVREWTYRGLRHPDGHNVKLPVFFDTGSNRPIYPRDALDAFMADLGHQAAREAS